MERVFTPLNNGNNGDTDQLIQNSNGEIRNKNGECASLFPLSISAKVEMTYWLKEGVK